MKQCAHQPHTPVSALCSDCKQTRQRILGRIRARKHRGTTTGTKMTVDSQTLESIHYALDQLNRAEDQLHADNTTPLHHDQSPVFQPLTWTLF